MIIVETFQGAALSDHHRRPASGSTPHDRRRASHHATPFRLASSRAPEQDDHVLTTSADSLKAPLPYPPLASSPPKKPVVFAPHDNTGRLPPPPPLRRSVRDLQIPIGCPQPNRASPSRGFLLTRLSDAGPAQPARLQRGRRPKPFSAADGRCDVKRPSRIETVNAQQAGNSAEPDNTRLAIHWERQCPPRPRRSVADLGGEDRGEAAGDGQTAESRSRPVQCRPSFRLLAVRVLRAGKHQVVHLVTPSPPPAGDPFPSPGVTRLHRYYKHLRHPTSAQPSRRDRRSGRRNGRGVARRSQGRRRAQPDARRRSTSASLPPVWQAAPARAFEAT